MDEAITGIYARESPAIDRVVQLGAASGRVISVSFPEEVPADAAEDHPVLERLLAALDGEEDDFGDVTVALTVPTPHRGVLEEVRTIPYGRERDVASIARSVPDLDDEDGETVRAALRENPLPILIPDHRVPDGPSAAPAAVEARLRSLEGI
ncbi:MGMT family protein [Saliphagus infecundisoli]|uniref:MGMT family protein n=1 Tax=Saliphagus infecundisoli TaxID=1849069 RepID=A0ABD5QD76_9EURY|nr:MGMT family protein [Saliphagus infecundisoli]